MISTDCRKCARSDFCYVDDKPCIGYEPKKLTNADRIREMSDDELAKFMCHVDCAFCHIGLNDWLDWLKQEAKE